MREKKAVPMKLQSLSGAQSTENLDQICSTYTLITFDLQTLEQN